MATACFNCNENIDSQSVSALESKFHQECFICFECLRPFPEGSFIQAEDKHLYCEQDYYTIFGDRCARCGELIMERMIDALDLKWHADHFTCDHCGKVLAGSSYMKKGDRPFCKECHLKLKNIDIQVSKTECPRCKKPILKEEETLIYEDQKHHAFHFTCVLCSKQLNKDYKKFNGQLYCPEDYIRATAPPCYVCKKPIYGRIVTAMGKSFHPEHFVCSKCEQPFDTSTFHEHQGRPYCELHFNELAGSKCGRCFDYIRGKVIPIMNQKWCENHFVCFGCEKNMANEGGKYYCIDEKPYLPEIAIALRTTFQFIKMPEVAVEQKIKLASKFILDSPPGEFHEVLNDVRLLINDDVKLQGGIKKAVHDYNVEQFITCKLNENQNDDEEDVSQRAIVSKYNEQADGTFVDFRSKQKFKFDHIKQTASNVEQAPSQHSHEDLRAAVDVEVKKYSDEHYVNGCSSTMVNGDKIAVVTASNKYNPSNFWNGRWRSEYVLTASSKGSVAVTGFIKVQVHYYEDGNVQLNSSKDVSFSVDFSDSPQKFAAALVKRIKEEEVEYQSALNESYAQLSDATFKSLRRALPVTRNKIEWSKISGYKVGSNLGQQQ
ncbi:hypothetical protein MP228_002749 [Amoeboaphelidium protococcarum]|nr:hypothetical protein MP228_002749 [Amoeboaphelidium protococcarum]